MRFLTSHRESFFTELPSSSAHTLRHRELLLGRIAQAVELLQSLQLRHPKPPPYHVPAAAWKYQSRRQQEYPYSHG